MKSTCKSNPFSVAKCSDIYLLVYYVTKKQLNGSRHLWMHYADYWNVSFSRDTCIVCVDARLSCSKEIVHLLCWTLVVTPYDILLSLQDGMNPLMWASYKGNIECVKLLLDRGAEVNIQNKVSEV